MNLEQKIDALIKGQTAIISALANLTPGTTAVDLAPALAAIQAVSDKIDAQVGADSTGTTAPAPEAAANTTSEAGATQAST